MVPHTEREKVPTDLAQLDTHLKTNFLKKKPCFFLRRWVSWIRVGMFFACGIWCVAADVSSASPSSEQTEGLWGNQCLNSWQFIYSDGKVKFCHLLKLVASNWSKICLKLFLLKIVHWFRWEPMSRGLKMSLCSFLFRVSLFPPPWCKLIPQISMCSCKWPGRSKCPSHGFWQVWSFVFHIK